jgi:hypothetical protein
MDRDTDLFVQAFWVKCRDVIRPELDTVVDQLKHQGHEVHVATQEYSPVADTLPAKGPVLTLTVHPKGAPAGRTLQFHGDVSARDLEIIDATGKSKRYDLSVLDVATARREIAAWVSATLAA